MSNIEVLDKGFVKLVDVMGSDKSIVNSARISFAKQVEEIGARDEKLIRYLWEHKHTSPFRHATLQFHIKAPLFVLRQWMKHQVGCAWNEVSGRYVEFMADDKLIDTDYLKQPITASFIKTVYSFDDETTVPTYIYSGQTKGGGLASWFPQSAAHLDLNNDGKPDINSYVNSHVNIFGIKLKLSKFITDIFKFLLLLYIIYLIMS